ncbi:hypothetical protein PC128_g23455 [Phytophthora cactorum]|nr:hypothetical protein PC128_g23455 [Phytophthora cactorum]
MRLQLAFVAVITGIAAGTSDVAAATDTTLIVCGPPTPVKALDAELTARNGRRLLRNYKAADEDKGGGDDDREARHGVKTGLDEDMDHTLSILDSEAKRYLSEYYKRLFDEGIQIPVRLRPIVNYKDRFKTHDTYYFGFPGENQYFKLRNSEHKVVSGKALTDLLKTIRWMDTFLSLLSELEVAQETASNVKAPATKAELKMAQNVNANLNIIRKVIFSNASDVKRQSDEPYGHDDVLQKIFDDAESAFQAYGEAQKQYVEAKEAVKELNSKSLRSALKATQSAFKATNSVYNSKAKRYSDARPKLEARGLRGAGRSSTGWSSQTR